VLLDAMSVQGKKLSDVSTGVARISAQQREVSAEKLMELVQDGIEVALTGLADKVYTCVSISVVHKDKCRAAYLQVHTGVCCKHCTRNQPATSRGAPSRHIKPN